MRPGRVGSGELPDDTPTVVADVSTREGAVAAVEAARELGPLTAIHAAGVLRDGAWRHQTPDDLDVVWGPKVGAVQAGRGVGGQPTGDPRADVLGSKPAGRTRSGDLQCRQWGDSVRGRAVAGSEYGHPALWSVVRQWHGHTSLDRMAAEGILPIAPDAGASALALAVAAGCAGRRGGLRSLRGPSFGGTGDESLAGRRRAEDRTRGRPARHTLRGSGGWRSRRCGGGASVLGMAADALDPGVGFFDLGLDSLMAVTVSEQLRHVFSERFPTTSCSITPRSIS